MDQQKKIIPQYINAKAGMDSVNTETIAKKVAQLTSGTPKDLHQKQLQKKRSLQVVSMIQKIMKYKKQDRQQIKLVWSKKIKQLNESRPLQSYWAHLDFDMFYVACQLLQKPQCKDLPCAVGGENSVLCTANYAARLYGVRAAMPTFVAKKLCPQIILFKPDFEKYRKFSDIFKQILMRFDPNLQSHGLDQAYIDISSFLKDKDLAFHQQFIKKIRTEVYQKTGLTVSCGVGANKMLAKMCSQQNKPNGQFILQNNQRTIIEFMKDKRIRKIPGIGPVNQFYLKGLKIQTAKDILQNTDILAICFSQNSCQFFVGAALGLGSIQHQFKQRKSVGKSQTFRPNSQKQFIESKLLELCEQVQHQLEQLGFVSINVVLSYQHQNYDRKDKTFNLDKYTNKKDALFNAVVGHLRDNILNPKKLIRLLGVKCTNLMKINQWKRKSLQSFFSKVKQKQKEKSKSKQIQKQIDRTKQKSKPNLRQKQNQKQKDRLNTINQQTLIVEAKTQEIKPEKTSLKQDFFMSEIKQKSQFICPICNTEIHCSNNLSAFNRHIDKCLKKVK